VYPPVRTAFFTPDPTVGREDWLLVVAALEPYKRTDVVIEAANQARLPLKVAGDGTQLAALRALAGPTVQLLGRVDDPGLRDLYRKAAALVFAQQEDFGITAIEAHATGCPVVAYAAGGALETVSEQTGVFFDRQVPQALIDAVARLCRTTIDAAHCRASAERFSEGRFDTAILEHAAALLD
jgi:glycosyltransferase involved in cell wall biosynthesis